MLREAGGKGPRTTKESIPRVEERQWGDVVYRVHSSPENIAPQQIGDRNSALISFIEDAIAYTLAIHSGRDKPDVSDRDFARSQADDYNRKIGSGKIREVMDGNYISIRLCGEKILVDPGWGVVSTLSQEGMWKKTRKGLQKLNENMTRNMAPNLSHPNLHYLAADLK